MTSIPIYSQNETAPRYAIAIDLSAGDWVSPSGALTKNPQSTSYVYAGTAGDLMVVYAGNPDVVVPMRNFVAGYLQEMGIIKIVKAGTTAQDIVVLY